MLKRLFQLLTLAALVNLAYQYWPRSGGELVPVKGASGRCGFVDYDGRVRIDFEWDYTFPFDDESGMACVVGERKFGAIDRSGQLKVPFEYDDQFSFNEFGLAKVKKGELYGYVNHRPSRMQRSTLPVPRITVYQRSTRAIQTKA